MKAGRALALAVSANAAFLLGCAALQQIQSNVTGNKPPASPTPVAGASPTATSTPIGAALGDRLNKIGENVQGGVKDMAGKLDARQEAATKAIDAITPEQERAVGQAAAINIIQQSGGLVLEEGLTRYVNDLANFVASKGDRKGLRSDGSKRIKARRFFVGVLDSDEMNAFALPGGYILVTRGLVENLSCESDLAWVLGHEIAHIDSEDGLGALKKAIGLKGFMDSSSGESKFDNPKFFEWIADKLANITYKIGLDKDKELAADKLGLAYAKDAGYDSQGAKRVLQLLATMPQSKVRLFESHDPPARRLEYLGGAVDSQPKGKLGVERFDRNAIQRFEAVKAASSGTAPGAP